MKSYRQGDVRLKEIAEMPKGLFECTILNLPVIIILLGAVVLILAVREQKKRMRK